MRKRVIPGNVASSQINVDIKFERDFAWVPVERGQGLPHAHKPQESVLCILRFLLDCYVASTFHSSTFPRTAIKPWLWIQLFSLQMPAVPPFTPTAHLKRVLGADGDDLVFVVAELTRPGASLADPFDEAGMVGAAYRSVAPTWAQELPLQERANQHQHPTTRLGSLKCMHITCLGHLCCCWLNMNLPVQHRDVN